MGVRGILPCFHLKENGEVVSNLAVPRPKAALGKAGIEESI